MKQFQEGILSDLVTEYKPCGNTLDKTICQLTMITLIWAFLKM